MYRQRILMFLKFNRYLLSSFFWSKNFTNNILYKILLSRLFYFNFKSFVPINSKDRKYSKLFFIIGSGRSGTTILRAMLSVHERIVIPLNSII